MKTSTTALSPKNYHVPMASKPEDCSPSEFDKKTDKEKLLVLTTLLNKNNPEKFRILIDSMLPFDKESFPFYSIVGENGDTILHWMAREGHSDLMTLIKENKRCSFHKYPFRENCEKKLCLFYAMDRNDEPMVKFLMSRINFSGVYIDSTNEIGALDYAIQKKTLPMVRICIEKGCHINMKNSANHSPLYTAKKIGTTEIVEYLESEGAELTEEEISIQNEPELKDISLKKRMLNFEEGGPDYKRIKV